MSLSNKIKTASNVATTVAAVLLSAVLVKAYLLPASAPRRLPVAAEAAVGTSLKGRVPGVDWKKNGQTLVLAISTKCHFCQESAPFYRKLHQEVGNSVKVAALVPQSAAEAAEYLNSEGVHVDDVKQAAMGDIGVRGTPTMLLVNNAGL